MVAPPALCVAPPLDAGTSACSDLAIPQLRELLAQLGLSDPPRPVGIPDDPVKPLPVHDAGNCSAVPLMDCEVSLGPATLQHARRTSSADSNKSESRPAAQLPVTNCGYKTALCTDWQLHGTCQFGERCESAHGARELRTPVENEAVVTSLARLSSRFSRVMKGRAKAPPRPPVGPITISPGPLPPQVLLTHPINPATLSIRVSNARPLATIAPVTTRDPLPFPSPWPVTPLQWGGGHTPGADALRMGPLPRIASPW